MFPHDGTNIKDRFHSNFMSTGYQISYIGIVDKTRDILTEEFYETSVTPSAGH